MKIYHHFAFIAIILGLSGCAEYKIRQFDDMTPMGPPFNQLLAHKYSALAKKESRERYEQQSGMLFIEKALISAEGKPVLPEKVEDYQNLNPQEAAAFQSERIRLINALDAGGRDSNPEAASTAQIAFDYRIEKQNKGKVPEELGEHHDEYVRAMFTLTGQPGPVETGQHIMSDGSPAPGYGGNLLPPDNGPSAMAGMIDNTMNPTGGPAVPPLTGPMSDSQPVYGLDVGNMPSQEQTDLQTAQAQGMIQMPPQMLGQGTGGMPPQMMPQGQPNNPSDVFNHQRTFEHALFKLNSADLTPQAKSALDHIILEIKRVESQIGRPVAITVVGHTDATGSEDRNIDLSLRRAYAARGYLHTNGITADRVNIDGRGSTEPLVKNKRGKAEPGNRRVDVYMHD